MAGMAEEPVRQVKVWDGWIRLVHWGIVSLIGISWVSMRTGNAEVHYLSGYAVLTLLLFRLAWGVAGSDTARFSRFLRSPLAALRAPFGRSAGGSRTREIGHNAAGGWMVLVLLGLLLVQARHRPVRQPRAGLRLRRARPLGAFASATRPAPG